MARRVVEKRNVVVLGKTGGGKSTVANQILRLCPTHAPSDDFDISHDVLVSITSNVELRALVLHDGGMQYQVNVIDTIGLFDTSGAGKSPIEIQRMNDQVMKDLKNFMEVNIPEGINLILFIYKHDRWTDEEQRTYECILKHFKKEISSISALVVTGCEGFTEDKRRNVIGDFRRKKPHIAEFMQKGIHPVGFPDLTKLKAGLEAVFEPDIKQDRDALKRLVCSADRLKLNVTSDEYKGIWGKIKAFAEERCTIL